MSKPVYSIELSSDAKSCLEAHEHLAAIQLDIGFHTRRKLRHPLGIYNVSVTRISDRLSSLCRRIEGYFSAANRISDLKKCRSLRVELIDYLELSIFAAAEHVDDLTSIASGFFSTTSKANQSSAYRKFIAQLKDQKRFLSTVANAIKHNQSRIRLYTCEFRQGGLQACLHGYFVEGAENGEIGPIKLLHAEQQVFSVTTLPWEIIVFVLLCSRALSDFLLAVLGEYSNKVHVTSESFSKAIAGAARLPLYTFGEVHPFDRALIAITAPSDRRLEIESGLFGTTNRPWSVTIAPEVLGDTTEYEGDGSTRTFNLVRPRSIGLRTWK